MITNVALVESPHKQIIRIGQTAFNSINDPGFPEEMNRDFILLTATPAAAPRVKIRLE